MAREYLRQATPAEMEELKKQKQAYCKENPDTDEMKWGFHSF
jgi:hypothetical protein